MRGLDSKISNRWTASDFTWTLGIWTVGCDGDLSALWFSKKSKHIVDNQENDGKGEDEITQKTPKIIINYSL
jgi:hypothetical protein